MPASLRYLPKDPAQSGLLAAAGAFFCWGLLPVFWKSLASVDPLEVLFQRMVWSFISLFLYLLLTKQLGNSFVIFSTPKSLLTLSASGLLLSCNWFLYIWAINSNQVIEASLGYFINPLLNILTGLIFFKERVSRAGWVSIALAFAGVLFQAVTLGHIPLVALGLSCTFAAYGLLRKVIIVEALPGLFVETVVMLPFAAGYLIWQASLGNSAFFRGNIGIDLLLMSAGIITTIPLFWFAYGARRIRMTTLGLMQYTTPSMVFLLGIFLYGESLSKEGFVTFACIWCAIGIYSWDSIRAHRKAA